MAAFSRTMDQDTGLQVCFRIQSRRHRAAGAIARVIQQDKMAEHLAPF
jgi:hypothetical protein